MCLMAAVAGHGDAGLAVDCTVVLEHEFKVLSDIYTTPVQRAHRNAPLGASTWPSLHARPARPSLQVHQNLSPS